MEVYPVDTIEGITDPVEKRFARLALSQELIVTEPPMIALDRPKKNKWDKRSTVPDFLIRRDKQDPGIFVEITVANLSSRKTRQNNVMVEAGLAHRYVQLTMADIEAIENLQGDVYEYLQEKIRQPFN